MNNNAAKIYLDDAYNWRNKHFVNTFILIRISFANSIKFSALTIKVFLISSTISRNLNELINLFHLFSFFASNKVDSITVSQVICFYAFESILESILENALAKAKWMPVNIEKNEWQIKLNIVYGEFVILTSMRKR